MGYTHHWNNVNLTDELVEDAVAIVHSTDVELTDDDGYGDPAIVSFAELNSSPPFMVEILSQTLAPEGAGVS